MAGVTSGYRHVVPNGTARDGNERAAAASPRMGPSLVARGGNGGNPEKVKSKCTIAPDGADLTTRTGRTRRARFTTAPPGRLFVGRSRSQGSRPELPTRTAPEPTIAIQRRTPPINDWRRSSFYIFNFCYWYNTQAYQQPSAPFATPI